MSRLLRSVLGLSIHLRSVGRVVAAGGAVGNSLLREDGAYLLREDGGQIVRES